ncbi:MAG: RNA methyltransferase [Flavobacteriales bacterium]|nr:MAG: RNA methyltransferase [Flavobacteriales bacterium]
MLSKNQIKLITSLQQKKYRNKHGCFIAEGEKLVWELIKAAYRLENLYCTKAVANDFKRYKPIILPESSLKKISILKTPNSVLAVFKIPKCKAIQTSGLILALDKVRDPGNLGTIIRLCDWFGVAQLVCSEDTVDCYNPKVVQATMGSLARVSIVYTNLETYLKQVKSPVYGAFMDGKPVYKLVLPQNAVLIMGNEANGISNSVQACVNNLVSIPKYNSTATVESLNVATATAILLNEFRRGV